MSKQEFGLAGFLDPHCRIYYESIFSQFQIGRVADLLCALAADSGAHLPSFRAVTTAGLTEACRFQGLFNSTFASLEPVAVEYGRDAQHVAISVLFSVTEDLRKQFESAVKDEPTDEILVIRRLSRNVSVKYHPKTGRAEFLCELPYDFSEVELRDPVAIDYIQIENSGEESFSENEYIELGDVEYAKILSEAPQAEGVPVETNAKKIIEAATSTAAKAEAELSQDIDHLLDKNHSKQAVFEALANSASVEQMAETIKRNLNTDEIATLITQGDAKKLAEILTEKTTEDELNRMVTQVLSDESKAKILANADEKNSAKILKDSLSESEVVRVITENLSDADKAKVIAQADPKKSAELLQEAMSREDLSEVLRGSLSEEDQAKALADAIPKSEVAELLAESLTEKEKASLVAAANPAAAGKILHKALEREELNRLISEALPDEDKAKALAHRLSANEVAEIVSENLGMADKARILAHLDPEKSIELIKNTTNELELAKLLAEQLSQEQQAEILMEALPTEVAGELLASRLTKEEKARILSKGNAKFAAKVLKQMHTPEEVADLLKEALPEEERGEILSEGLEQEEIAQIIRKSTDETDRAELLAHANPEAVAKVIKETVSEEKLEELIQKELPKAEIAKALAKQMPEKELARMVKGSIPEDELAQIVRAGLPEEELAQLVKGCFDPEDLAQLVRGGLPEEEVAHLIKGSSSEEELKTIVRGGADAKKIAEAVLVGSTKEEAAELLKSAVGEERIADAIATALPPEELAKAAAATLPPTELIRIAKSAIPQDELAKTIARGLTSEQIAQLASPALKDAELAGELLKQFTAKQLAEHLKDHLPSKLISDAAQSRMTEEQIIDVLSTGLPRPDLARILTSALPRESFSQVLVEGLPAQEIAHALSEGLPREKFAQLLTAAIPKAELGKLLQESGLSGSAPTQSRFEAVQVATLLNPEVTRQQALSVLSTVFPRNVAETMCTGGVPKESIIEAIQEFLPNPELAPTVTSSLFRFRSVPDAPEQLTQIAGSKAKVKPDYKSALDTSPEAAAASALKIGGGTQSPARENTAIATKTGVAPGTSPASPSAHAPSFEQEKARLEKAFQGKLAESKKAAEFYLNRAKKLEEKLRATEEEKRTAESEAAKAKSDLERTLALDIEKDEKPEGDKNMPAAAKPEESKSSTHQDKDDDQEVDEHDTKTLNALELQGKRDKEAVRFFQKKARELESELRRAEGEIRRLNAEHTKELLKLSKSKEQKPVATDPTPAAAQEPKAATKDVAKTTAAAVTPEASPQNSPEIQKDEDWGKDFLQQQIKTLEAKLKQSNDEKAKLAQKLTEVKSRIAEKIEGPEKSAETTERRAPDAADSTKAAIPTATTTVTATHLSTGTDKGADSGAQQPARTQAQGDSPAGGTSELQVRVYQSRIKELEEKLARLENQPKTEVIQAPSAHREPEEIQEIQAKTTAQQPGATKPDPEPGEIPKLRVSEPDAGDNDDVPKKMEEEVGIVDQDLTTIVRKMETLKEKITDEPVKRTVEGLMTAVMQERSRLATMSQELSKSIRKKELAFKNHEAILTEELKRTRTIAEQRQNNIDRMKQQMQEFQRRAEVEKAQQAQSSGADAQVKIKYEHSLKQIETLSKEIEKANRRIQTMQQANPGAQREAMELKKQLETAGKALLAKKQEADVLKAQVAERDKKETEYKRVIMKLQNELNATKTATKKAA